MGLPLDFEKSSKEGSAASLLPYGRPIVSGYCAYPPMPTLTFANATEPVGFVLRKPASNSTDDEARRDMGGIRRRNGENTDKRCDRRRRYRRIVNPTPERWSE